MLRAGLLGRRGFFWSSKKTVNVAAPLIDKDEEMKIMQYRGKIEDFNTRASDFEMYLRDQEVPEVMVEADKTLLPGRCTGEGSLRFKNRAIDKGIPAKNFRRPYDLPAPKNPSDAHLSLSTVGVGTYLGKPDDEDDFDMYIALKYLLKSSTVNVIDTAINYRCQKSERTIGAVLRNLLSDDVEPIQRDEIFVSSKNGYVPDDSDNGLPASHLI